MRGDSNKYPPHMFLGILNTILFNFFNNPFHFELKIRSIQIVVITSFVVISNVCIKRFDFRPVLFVDVLLVQCFRSNDVCQTWIVLRMNRSYDWYPLTIHIDI